MFTNLLILHFVYNIQIELFVFVTSNGEIFLARKPCFFRSTLVTYFFKKCFFLLNKAIIGFVVVVVVVVVWLTRIILTCLLANLSRLVECLWGSNNYWERFTSAPL